MKKKTKEKNNNKSKKNREIKKGEVILYTSRDGKISLDVKLEKGTVWLTQKQIAEIFETERSVITRHLGNIFKTGELREKSNVQKMHIANSDKPVKFYNLDAIISIGYRVNSRKATRFRIWATEKLRDYIVKGYIVNQKRLLSEKRKFKDLQEAIEFLRKKSHKEVLKGQEREIIELLADYSKTLTILEEYDKSNLKQKKSGRAKFKIGYDEVKGVIEDVKNELIVKKEASNIFGVERGKSLAGAIGNIYQTFGKKDLYESLEEKAAHLLYFIIKDHPFLDGNKRIGSFIFVYFLDRNNYLFRENGERKINDNALAALALLVAESKPKEKDLMISLITNLIQ